MTDTNIDTLVAQRVRAVQAANHLTVEETAKALRLSRNAAGQRLNGRHPFSLKELDLFAQATGYSREDFLADDFMLHAAPERTEPLRRTHVGQPTE